MAGKAIAMLLLQKASRLRRSSSMEPHLLEGDGVGLELSLRLLGKLEALRVARRVALDGAEAAV